MSAENQPEVLGMDALKGVSVLIVDDERINRFVISRYLEKWNVTFDQACDGRGAICKILENRYDLVFMDLNMPVMDGLESAIAIRQLEGDQYRSLPIVALSSSRYEDVKGDLEAGGFCYYISKPFEPDDLLQTLLTCVGC